MKQREQGYRVAVTGSSSLMGRELLAVLEERKFPMGTILKLDDVPEDPDVPSGVDDELSLKSSDADALAECDFIFVASESKQNPSYLQAGLDQDRLSGNGSETRRVIIDLAGGGTDIEDGLLSIPHLDRAPAAAHQNYFISPHAAAIVMSTLLLRLGARFPMDRAAATIFVSASEAGPQAIEELHKQTMNLMSFQKLPKGIFGTQLAFNLLPHFSGPARMESQELEARVRSELSGYLEGKTDAPALRFIHVPVFYSLAISLYIETAAPVAAEAVEQALAGKPVRFIQSGDEAPSPVGIAGSSEILVDSARPDPDRPEAIWLWAVADNLRLGAENAVAIAERAAAGRGL